MSNNQMIQNRVRLDLLVCALTGFLIMCGTSMSVYAQTPSSHAHEEKHEDHDNAQGHQHDDGDEHVDHDEENDSHDEHGHEAHSGEDVHDTHGHEDGHDDEGVTNITNDSAKKMGIVVEEANSGLIDQTVPLNGRVTLNKDTTADVLARFPGIVRSVKVGLGSVVSKGQVLATIEANESLQSYNVTAPVSGVILSRNTNVGSVANDQPLFKIADMSDVWARFHVFPRDAGLIKEGQEIKVYSLDGGAYTQGKIDMLFPVADELSQTQVAIVVLSNAEHLWKPGMIVTGQAVVSQKSVPVAVKSSALQKMEDLGDVVFVQEGEKYSPRPVVPGRHDGEYVEITKGLRAGEMYVSDGSFVVKSDMLKSTAAHSH